MDEEPKKCSSCDSKAVYEILDTDPEEDNLGPGEGYLCCEVCKFLWWNPKLRRL